MRLGALPQVQGRYFVKHSQDQRCEEILIPAPAPTELCMYLSVKLYKALKFNYTLMRHLWGK